jgi:hypothetical protein
MALNKNKTGGTIRKYSQTRGKYLSFSEKWKIKI